MLVVTSEKGHSLVIGRTVRVTILDIRGEKVRLGFVRPVDMPIVRSTRNDITPRKSRPFSSFQGNVSERQLVLTLERGVKICLGDDVVLSLVQVRGEHARLGVSCPLTVEITRGEVNEAIERLTERGQLSTSEEDPRRSDRYESMMRHHGSGLPKPPVELRVLIDHDRYTTAEAAELLTLVSELYYLETGDRLTINKEFNHPTLLSEMPGTSKECADDVP